jgi:hypothetical protein
MAHSCKKKGEAANLNNKLMHLFVIPKTCLALNCKCIAAAVEPISIIIDNYTVRSQTNGEVSKVNKKFISHLTRVKRTPSAAVTVQVSRALPAVRFSCLLRGRGASFQDGVTAGKGFLCAPF